MTEKQKAFDTESSDAAKEGKDSPKIPEIDPKDLEKFQRENPLEPDDPSRVLAESSATELSYEDLLLKRYLEQTFNIHPKIKLTMRSVSAGAAELIIRKLSNRYGREWVAVFDEISRIYYVAASMQEMNEQPTGPDFDAALMEDEDKAMAILDERAKTVKQLPHPLTSLIYAHYVLFNLRVENFIKGGADELGNS